MLSCLLVTPGPADHESLLLITFETRGRSETVKTHGPTWLGYYSSRTCHSAVHVIGQEFMRTRRAGSILDSTWVRESPFQPNSMDISSKQQYSVSLESVDGKPCL